MSQLSWVGSLQAPSPSSADPPATSGPTPIASDTSGIDEPLSRGEAFFSFRTLLPAIRHVTCAELRPVGACLQLDGKAREEIYTKDPQMGLGYSQEQLR